MTEERERAMHVQEKKKEREGGMKRRRERG